MRPERLSYLSPKYLEKLLELRAQKRKESEEVEIREENIQWLLFQNKQSSTPVDENGCSPMPNYASKKYGQKVWIPVVGHSMICKDESLSIPNRSKVFGRKLSNDPRAIPLNK